MTLPLAVFADYAGLVAACRARRIQLGMSQLEVDDRAGLPSGYTGKIEISATNPTAKNSRSIGKDSLPLLLGALGLELAVVKAGQTPPSSTDCASKNNGMRHVRAKFFEECGRDGGQRGWWLLSDAERKRRIDRITRASVRARKARQREKRGNPAAAKP